MATLPHRPSPASPPPSVRDAPSAGAPLERDARSPDDEETRRHRERVHASMTWALDEYATTLAKLAK